MSKTNSDRILIAIEIVVAMAIVTALLGKSYGSFSTFLFIICAVSFAITGKFLLRMLTSLSDPRLEIIDDPIDELRVSLLREKKLLTEGIKELEADYAAGKVDDLDYEALRGSAEARALAVIKRLKNQDARWLAAAKEAAGLESNTEDRPVSKPIQTHLPSSTPTKAHKPADPRVFNLNAVKFTNNQCSHCETINPVDARYCIGCGGRRVESN